MNLNNKEVKPTKRIIILGLLLFVILGVIFGFARDIKSTRSQTTTTSLKTTTATKTTTTETTKASLKIIPASFKDYRSLIGKDYSVLDVDSFDPSDSVHEIGKTDFFGHECRVYVDLAWDNRTIKHFSFYLENLLGHDEYEQLVPKIIDIFGDRSPSTLGVNPPTTWGTIHYSGKGDFELIVDESYAGQGTKVGYLDKYDSILLKVLDSKEELYIPPRPVTSSTTSITTVIRTTSAPDPRIGMTPEQVRASSWGTPSSINKTTTMYGVHEQWVYRSTTKTRYIYFDDGVVSAIQE